MTAFLLLNLMWYLLQVDFLMKDHNVSEYHAQKILNSPKRLTLYDLIAKKGLLIQSPSRYQLREKLNEQAAQDEVGKVSKT